MQKKICEISSPKQWKTISSDMLQTDGYPVYGANGIIGYYHEYNHKCETLLITCRGATCGALNICQPYSYVNGNAMALDNLSDDVDIKYLYYYLLNRGLSDVITGSAQPQIVRQSLDKVVVEYPVLNKQKEIVDNLNNIEELISYRKEQLNKLDELVKSRFIELFGTTGKQVPLTDYVWFQEGPGVRSVDFTDDGTILLTGSNINDNAISFGHKSDRHISNELASGKYAHFMCDKDDILVVSSAIDPDKFDKKVVVVDVDNKYCLNTGIIRFKPNKQYLTLGYFREFLKTDYFKHQVSSEMRGIAQMHFGPSHLKQMSILLPDSIESQIEFEKFVQQTDKSKLAVQQSLEKLETLKKSLMQQYFG